MTDTCTASPDGEHRIEQLGCPHYGSCIYCKNYGWGQAPHGCVITAKEAPLTFDEYQRRTKDTAVYPNIGHNFLYPALGLGGECGEVLENVKKAVRDDDGTLTSERRARLAKELGDCLWYVARLADECGLSLSDVAQGNLGKLAARKVAGTLHGSGDER